MLLEVKNLKKYFHSSRVKAVDGISFSVEEGQTFGVVGESGSGKSTLAKLILRFLDPDDGQILFEGKDISHAKENELKDFRRKTQIIFQEPYHSLDPHMRIGDILKEVFILSGERQKAILINKASELLRHVELPESFLTRYPRELSGGECQRIAIARAISLKPKLIICDEAVSSLDALVRAQILNLFLKLQREKQLSYLFISHDLKVIRHMSDMVMVIRDGQVCEMGAADDVFHEPINAYTKELIACQL